MPDVSSAVWTHHLTVQLVGALKSCSSMEDPLFRKTFVDELKDNLGTKNFHVAFHGDAALHIRVMVRSCQEYENPAGALRALYLTALELLPDTRAAKTLEACDRRINCWGTLSPARLHSVIDTIANLNSHPGPVRIRELVEGVRYEDEIFPGIDERAGLNEVVERLNQARITGHGPIPPVVRFIASLSCRLQGDDALRMRAEFDAITAELKLASADVIADTNSLLSRPESRILQICLSDEGPPGQPSYKIHGNVLQVVSGVRRNPVPLPSSQANDVDEVWKRFLREAVDLGRQIGSDPHLTVEFILPWPLLGYPVERWNIDQADRDDDSAEYWIGHRFPVVVRSLDRRAYEVFLGRWHDRWDMLFGSGQRRPLCDGMAWLHHGESDPPFKAQEEKRVVMVQGIGFLTSWLATNENRNTVTLGLTYAYRSDKLGKRSLRAAFQEGIPIIIWRRDGGDANELEALLANIAIHELKDKVLTWRRESAGPASEKVGAHIVVMWDDPTDVSAAFSAPQAVAGGK